MRAQRLVFVPAVLILLAGCAQNDPKTDSTTVGGNQPGKEQDEKKQEEPTKPKIDQAIGMAQGEAVRAESLVGGKRGGDVWRISWEAAELQLTDQGVSYGRMRSVKGVLYEGGKPSSAFSAEVAEASKDSDTLMLSGRVKIISSDKKSRLTAGRVEWQPKRKLLLATKNVTVEGDFGIFGPCDRIFASARLRQISTVPIASR